MALCLCRPVLALPPPTMTLTLSPLPDLVASSPPSWLLMAQDSHHNCSSEGVIHLDLPHHFFSFLATSHPSTRIRYRCIAVAYTARTPWLVLPPPHTVRRREGMGRRGEGWVWSRGGTITRRRPAPHDAQELHVIATISARVPGANERNGYTVSLSLALTLAQCPDLGAWPSP